MIVMNNEYKIRVSFFPPCHFVVVFFSTFLINFGPFLRHFLPKAFPLIVLSSAVRWLTSRELICGGNVIKILAGNHKVYFLILYKPYILLQLTA